MPPAPATPSSSLKIEVNQADAKNQAGVINMGWWGFALQPNTDIQGLASTPRRGLRGYRPGDRQPGQRPDRQDAGHGERWTAVGTDWKQYTFTLKTGAIEASALRIIS